MIALLEEVDCLTEFEEVVVGLTADDEDVLIPPDDEDCFTLELMLTVREDDEVVGFGGTIEDVEELLGPALELDVVVFGGAMDDVDELFGPALELEVVGLGGAAENEVDELAF